MLDWQEFCGAVNDEAKHDLSIPRIISGIKYATDQKIFVCAPTDEPNGDYSGRKPFPSIPKLRDMGLLDPQITDWQPWENCRCGWTGMIATSGGKCDCHRGQARCDICDGYGYQECDLGHKHDCSNCAGNGRYTCRFCDGTGIVKNYTTCPDCKEWYVRNRHIDTRYARLISQLRNVQWGTASDSDDDPVYFKFDDGGQGCVMPIVFKQNDEC